MNEQIIKYLSQERFDLYYNSYQDNTDIMIVKNTKISMKIFEILSLFEIIFRHKVDSILLNDTAFNQVGKDYLDSNSKILNKNRYYKIKNSIPTTLIKDYHFGANKEIKYNFWIQNIQNEIPDSIQRNRIVSNLSFGFWSTILQDFGERICNQVFIKKALKYYKYSNKIILTSFLNYDHKASFWIIRNRIAHHKFILNYDILSIAKNISNLTLCMIDKKDDIFYNKTKNHIENIYFDLEDLLK